MKRAERIVGLDGLRGVAILLVVAYHLWLELHGKEYPTGVQWWQSLLYAGNTGVTLFFVLSGFLVCTPFLKGMRSGQRYFLKEYAVQRLLRILPPYYVMICIGVLFTQHFEQLLPALLFASWGNSVGYFSIVWWSLATEVQFYFLVPLLFFLARQRWRLPLLLLIGLLASAMYMAVIFKWIVLPGHDTFTLQFGLILSLFGQLPAFLTGLGIAISYHLFGRPAKVGCLTEHVCAISLLMLLSWLLLPMASVNSIVHMWQAPWYVLVEAVIWGALVWVMLSRSPERSGLLDNPLTRYFGRISFSLYLVHMPVLQLVLYLNCELGFWFDLLLASALSIAAALLLYQLVEKPSLALKKYLLRRPQPLPGIQV